MPNITVIVPKNPKDFVTRKATLTKKPEKFLQITVPFQRTIGERMVLTIFEYLIALPKSSQWLLAECLSYRNYKTNITSVVGETAYEKEMIKLGYQQLFNDGIICRIQRGKYMINPNIVTVGKGCEEDAYNNWNAHCHIDAVLKFSVHELGQTMQIDGKKFYELIHLTQLKDTSDLDLKEFLELAKKFNWIDASNTPTGRATSDEGLDRVLLECKARKLI